MAKQRNGSAKKNLPYHNALILQKSKNLTVKDQSKGVSRTLYYDTCTPIVAKTCCG